MHLLEMPLDAPHLTLIVDRSDLQTEMRNCQADYAIVDPKFLLE